MKHLLIDPCTLGIFHKKQCHSFQLLKKSGGSLPLLPGSLRLLTYFKNFMSPYVSMPLKFLEYMALILDGG